MGYEILEHTADIGLKVIECSLQDLFITAAEGMTSLLVEGKIQGKDTIEIILQGESWEELFHDWLSEINYFFLVKQKIFQKFLFLELSPFRLKAICYGESCDPDRHTYLNEIKAVTYHRLKIIQEKTHLWSVQVYFDL